MFFPITSVECQMTEINDPNIVMHSIRLAAIIFTYPVN